MESPISARSCARCEQNPGTKKWVGEGGSLALSHGFYEMWCERCCVEVQLAYAEERAATIPLLQADLDRLGGRATGIKCRAMCFRIEQHGDGKTHVPAKCGLPAGHGGDHIPVAA